MLTITPGPTTTPDHEPGRWSYVTWLDGPRVTAIVSCPACGIGITLAPDIHAIKFDGTVTPSLVCPHKPCGFHEFIKLEDWGRHRDEIMQWFSYDHLPPNLQKWSKPFCELATRIHFEMKHSEERAVALRKLLEAKDAAVRAYKIS